MIRTVEKEGFDFNFEFEEITTRKEASNYLKELKNENNDGFLPVEGTLTITYTNGDFVNYGSDDEISKMKISNVKSFVLDADFGTVLYNSKPMFLREENGVVEVSYLFEI